MASSDDFNVKIIEGFMTIEVGADQLDVEASEATGEERDRLFAEQAERIPQFGEYAEQTGGRVIPVVLLTPAG